MSTNGDYKRAYERQREARERAENLLEERSADLFEANATLMTTNDRLQEQKSQLVQQEKLASIGLLAAGIAHEINNPIGFIKSNLESLAEYIIKLNELFESFKQVGNAIDSDPESFNYRASLEGLVRLARENNLEFIINDSLDSINESLAGTGRVKEIIANLRDFARTGNDRREECDLNEIIRNSLTLIRNEVKYRIEVELDLGSIPLIYGCTGQISQVFINIMLNASHAMEHSGTLRIKTYVNEDMVCTDFVDNGPGVEEENLKKLFDPFFTTKGVGEGTGLGLYISHGLIQNHKGEIYAFNESKGGARFTVSLPIDMRAQART